MSSNWIKIYTTEDRYKAEMIKQGLIANGIDAVVMNKQDSSYRSFGVLFVMIHPDNFDKAIEQISQSDIE